MGIQAPPCLIPNQSPLWLGHNCPVSRGNPARYALVVKGVRDYMYILPIEDLGPRFLSFFPSFFLVFYFVKYQLTTWLTGLPELLLN